MGELHNKMFRCFWSQTAFSSGCWTFWLLEFMINIHSPPPCFLWAIHRRQRIITPRIGCGFQSKFKFFFSLSLQLCIVCDHSVHPDIVNVCSAPDVCSCSLNHRSLSHGKVCSLSCRFLKRSHGRGKPEAKAEPQTSPTLRIHMFLA